MQGVRWLFFDLGNTLISEKAAVDSRIRQVVSSFERYGRRVSVEDVTITLREAWGSFHPRPIARAIEVLTDDRKIRQLVEAEARYPKELEQPYEGVEPVLHTLAPRYHIGVIANQSAGTEARLTRWGLMPFISVCLSSAEIGLEKPDPGIFRLALTRARCQPHHAVMIGDRLDNDIRPARLLGWKTIRILQGFARFQEPRDQLDEADATIADLAELLPLFPNAIGVSRRGGAAAPRRRYL
jgi:HAD superfamily hydrolase (TIGR01509 family)